MKRRDFVAGAGAAVLALPAKALAQSADRWQTLRTTVPLPPAVESGRQKVGEVELYYAIYGKGAPVLLLHPGLGHSDYWSNQVGPLSQTHQVIVADLRGHGRSTAADTPLSYGLLAQDILALIRKLSLRKPAILGWGDGAVVGLEFARRHPKRIRQLIAFGLVHDVSGQREGVDRTATFNEYVHKAAADYEQMAPEPKNFDARFTQLEALWASEPGYTPEQLVSIRVPTAILAAEHDEWVKPGHMEKAATLIPNAQLVMLPAVSHFAPWQAPKSFNDMVRFLLR